MPATKSNVLIIFSLILQMNFLSEADIGISSPMIGSHMVLQREMKVPIWGTANPDSQITIEFKSQTVSGDVDDSGHWKLYLDHMNEGGPFEMKISGDGSLSLTDVYVGEVWVGSGQSNMALKVEEYPEVLALAREDPMIKLNNYRNIQKGWTPCTEQFAENFSAILYTFGVSLRDSLNVPIGLVSRAVHGTATHRWLPSPDEAHTEDLLDMHSEWFQTTKPSNREKKPWADLYEKHIRPIQPFSIRGTIWDQGEAGSGLKSISLDKAFSILVREWRGAWAQGNFHFIFVQFPKGGGYRHEGELQPLPATPYSKAKIDSLKSNRIENFRETLSYPNTAAAVSFDLAQGTHPARKDEYGERFALTARATVYNSGEEYYGPLHNSVQMVEDTVLVQFKHVGTGLTTEGSEQLQGFTLAGSDLRYDWASARIVDDSTVAVWSASVAEPEYVMYGMWEIDRTTPIAWCNLFNKAGLPAFAFYRNVHDTTSPTPVSNLNRMHKRRGRLHQSIDPGLYTIRGRKLPESLIEANQFVVRPPNEFQGSGRRELQIDGPGE